MEKEVDAMQELSDAEMEQVSGAGAVTDAVQDVLRAVTNAVGGVVWHGGVMGGIRG